MIEIVHCPTVFCQCLEVKYCYVSGQHASLSLNLLIVKFLESIIFCAQGASLVATNVQP